MNLNPSSKRPPPINRRGAPPPLPATDERTKVIAAAVSLILVLLLIALLLFLLRTSSVSKEGGIGTGSSGQASGGDGGVGDDSGDSNGAQDSKAQDVSSNGSDSKQVAEIPPRPQLGLADAATEGSGSAPGDNAASTEPAEDPEADLGIADAGESPNPTLGSFSSAGVSFFGDRAEGNSVAFVIDISSSMGSGTSADGTSNFERVKQELRRSIKALKSNQSFTVIAFCDRAVFEPDLINQKADTTGKKRLSSWLDNLLSGGGTDPRDAVRLALDATPDIVYLLSDGEFAADCVDAIKRMNQKECVIHTVSIGMDAQTLRKIASDSGGRHTNVR